MNDFTRLVQLRNKTQRAVALVEGDELLLLNEVKSVYELALTAIRMNRKLVDVIRSLVSENRVDYNEVYAGTHEWKLLPSFDHPDGPLGCMVSGTGLTHKNSALNRQMMHSSPDNKPTDSIIMYQWGVEGGFPARGTIGVQAEWFYKGSGSVLRAHGESLEVPSFGNDGGEEPELAGAYVIDDAGNPWRVGFTTGNEFSDHVMEKKNYLYLAPSKLRTCAIGPELVVDATFDHFQGKVSVTRKSEVLWSSDIQTGEKTMAHSLENLEYHHFKYPGHRIPGQAHVHFFGADAFSFGNGIRLEDGDVMHVQWQGMGRALENPIRISAEKEQLIPVNTLR